MAGRATCDTPSYCPADPSHLRLQADTPTVQPFCEHLVAALKERSLAIRSGRHSVQLADRDFSALNGGIVTDETLRQAASP